VLWHPVFLLLKVSVDFYHETQKANNEKLPEIRMHLLIAVNRLSPHMKLQL